MNAPQFIMIGLMFLGLGVSLSENGKPRKGEHSFGFTLFATCLHFGVLYWGGFFSGAA